MHRRRTAGIVVLVILSIVASAPAFASTGDAKKPKGPKVVVDQACTMIWPERVEKAFGGPVVILPESTIAGPAACVATVGTEPSVPPGGTLQAFTEYPTIFSGNPTAVSSVEDRRAGDALSDDVLTDVDGVGRTAYFNHTKGTITVAANKKFAFTLQWTRVGAVAISDADRTKLTSLARNVVARFTR